MCQWADFNLLADDFVTGLSEALMLFKHFVINKKNHFNQVFFFRYDIDKNSPKLSDHVSKQWVGISL